MRPLAIAVPKGRVLKALVPLLVEAGLEASGLLDADRSLIRTAKWRDASPNPASPSEVRFLLLKPDDVPTYVDYGAADLGVVGRDVLSERDFDLYEPLDLGIGVCRLVVAAPAGVAIPGAPRVATKYPRAAAEHFARRGLPAEIVSVQGSVELAPLTGLADVIVDLVETGSTLRENGLEEREVVARVESVLVANRASYKLLADSMRPFVERLEAAVRARASRASGASS